MAAEIERAWYQRLKSRPRSNASMAVSITAYQSTRSTPLKLLKAIAPANRRPSATARPRLLRSRDRTLSASTSSPIVIAISCCGVHHISRWNPSTPGSLQYHLVMASMLTTRKLSAAGPSCQLRHRK